LIDTILSLLYETVKSEVRNGRKTSSKEGYAFEDRVSDAIFRLSKKLGFTSYPPRHILDWPSLSGNKYQFDASFSIDGVVYLVECKRKKFSSNENMFYFNAKLIDYLFAAGGQLPPEGIFLSTSPLERTARLYAIAYCIKAVDPEWPPLEHLLAALPADSKYRTPLTDLLQKIQENKPSPFSNRPRRNPTELLGQFEFLLNRLRTS
jgi:hypothetical protein